MSGARPSSFKKGGGFLNNVDAVIADYQFTDVFPGNEEAVAEGKSKDFYPLFALLSVRVDGANEDTTTTLRVGGRDDFEIEDDGHTLTPLEDGYGLRANTAWGVLIQSLVDAGFPETLLPEDKINYEPMLGTRVRLVQRTDEALTKKLGKRKDKKTGKEYDRQDLVVDKVYSLPTQGGKASTQGGKAKGGSKGSSVVDVDELAPKILKEILKEAKDRAMAKSKLSMAILKKMLKHPQSAVKEDVRKWLFDDDNLGSIDGVTYDASDKNQTVALD